MWGNNVGICIVGGDLARDLDAAGSTALIDYALAMMVSRGREFLADASGAELTRNPRARSARLRAAERTAAPPWPAMIDHTAQRHGSRAESPR